MGKEKTAQTIKKAIAEFMLIVVGVSIALWLENVLETIKEQEVEQAYIQSFHQDWKIDIKLVKQVIKMNLRLKEGTEQLFNDLQQNNITETDLPSRVFVLLNYQYFKPQDFTFKSIQETGDFRLLQDDQFKRDIMEIRGFHETINEAQRNYQQALDYHIVPLIMDNIDLANQKVVTSDFINDHRLLNLVSYTLEDLNTRIKACQSMLEFLEKVSQK